MTGSIALGAYTLTTSNTTVVANLNADLWDGNQFSNYLDQAVKTTSTPTFAAVYTSQLVLAYPIENYNPFTTNKFHSFLETNLILGRWAKLDVTLDGAGSATAATQLTNGDFEQYGALCKGVDGDAPHVININLTNNGLYPAGVGLVYSNPSKIIFSFYYTGLPSNSGMWITDGATIGAVSANGYYVPTGATQGGYPVYLCAANSFYIWFSNAFGFDHYCVSDEAPSGVGVHPTNSWYIPGTSPIGSYAGTQQGTASATPPRVVSAAYSGRVKDKDGVWYDMTLTPNGTSELVGTHNCWFYLTDIEVTFGTGTGAPYITGTTKWSLTQTALYCDRISASQGSSISALGGYLGGTVAGPGTVDAGAYKAGGIPGIAATVSYVDTLLGAKTLTFTKGLLTAQT
jgi:hypothetical protein